jgi:hypothetical protein
MNRKNSLQISVSNFIGSTLQIPSLMCLALLVMLGLAPSAWATTESLTGSADWTIPTGVSQVTVEMWGGGGGGGAKAVTAQPGTGGGGGGGGYSRAVLTGLTPGNTIAYSVGAGGAGGTVTGPTDGQAGGNTTFVGVTTANGGGGGFTRTSATNPNGGAGGTGSTGNGGVGGNGNTVNASGGNGGGAGGWNGTAGVAGGAGASTGATAGIGGGIVPSKGGDGGIVVSGNAGNPGKPPGGGGAAGSGASNPQKDGTNGAAGLIILTYIPASSTPIVEYPIISGITNTAATLGATVTTNSGLTIDDYGVVYSQTSLNNDPTVGGSGVTKVQKGTSIANGTAFTTNIVGLTAGTQYSFKGYAHTTSGYGYSSPASSFLTLANEPTSQASGVNISSTQKGAFTINWTRGNGANCIVLLKAGSVGTTDPTDGTTYTGTTVFGSGSLIGSGSYVVYVGSGNSVTVSGLTLGTSYSVRVFELNGAGGSENYLTPTSATNSATAVGNNYYSFGNNAPTSVVVWWTATDGTGNNPANFTSGDTFIIQSGSTYAGGGVNWTLSGGAKLVINSGGTLDMNGDKLFINGSFVNNGTFANSAGVPTVNFINTSVAGGGTDFSSTLTVGSNYNVSVLAVGAGGGGAGAGNPTNSSAVTGGGGGGGASAYSTDLVLQAGNAYQVTVGGNGGRGTAGSSFGGSGGAGGASSFGGGFVTTVLANGGGAGLASTFDGINVIQGADGAGGAAGTAGNAGNYAGGSAAGGGGGGAADDAGAGIAASAGTGGSGGSGVVAQGGAGGSIASNTAGTAGGAPGGGGSGGNWTTGANKAAGVGGVGWVAVQFISVSTAPSTANYRYQSRASGDWNNFNTWSVDKGSGFVNAASGEIPNNGHSNVVVQSGHTVTVVAAAVTVNLTVNSGGILTVNGSLAVNRLTGQTSANNLTVNGILNVASLSLGNNTTNLVATGAVLNQTAAVAVSEGTGVQLTINGSYVQNVTGSGKIPVAIWGAASTCTINSTFTSNIDGGGNDAQLNYGQTFGNFIWNAQGGTTNVVYRMTQSTATNWNVGNLTISNTAGTPAHLELTGTSALNTSVTNLTMTGGDFRAGGAGSALTVNGPMAISAGTFDTGGTITALDNVSITGSAQVTGNARFSFSKAGSQSWTVTSTNALTGPAWVVNSGTALTLGSASQCTISDLTVNGTLEVSGNSTLVVNGSSVPSTNNAGSITVTSGSTVGGNGAIGASVTLSAGAFAANQIGFDTNGGVNTTLTLTNALVLNGNTFNVNTGTNVLAAGDYLLITNIIGGITGSFASSPVISGAGLTGGATGTVVTTANTVTLHVATTSSGAPVITSTVLIGGDLIISGTNSSGTAGGTYYVRATNNVATPMASWPRISTNTYGVGGAFSVTNAVNPAVPVRFFRIEQ